MKKWNLLLLLFLLSAPLICHAGVPGYLKQQMGTLNGQVITEDNKEVPGGIVSFFDTNKGIPPLIANMHRIPDMVGRMGPDGKFSVKLVPGSYYMGAMIINDPGRGPGPPREGDIFYFAKNDKGELREFTIKTREVKDTGQVIGALSDTFPVAKNIMTIEGKLLMDNGKPFAGGIVLVKTDMNKNRPDFVSIRTGEDGKFSLKLPPDTDYYLLGRERSVGRPVPGSYVGTYGSTSAISEGGALPIGGARPAQPASGMPNVSSVTPGPGDDQPVAVKGKAGETLTGFDIIMFRLPVPGEQRLKLQGTLGFGDQYKEKMDKSVPLESSPAKEK